MIDFTNSAYVKMKQVDPNTVLGDIQPILINGEQVIGAYKAREITVVIYKQTCHCGKCAGNDRKKERLYFSSVLKSQRLFNRDCRRSRSGQ